MSDWSVLSRTVGECALMACWCRYGLLRKPDVPELLNLAISPLPSTWWSRWRGRLGLSPDETRDLYRTAYDGLPNKKKDRVPVALGDSVPLLFKTWDGEELSVLAYEGETIMARLLSLNSSILL